jgi:hypothetical protein
MRDMKPTPGGAMNTASLRLLRLLLRLLLRRLLLLLLLRLLLLLLLLHDGLAVSWNTTSGCRDYAKDSRISKGWMAELIL